MMVRPETDKKSIQFNIYKVRHAIPILKNHFGLDNELTMRILKRGYLPEGGGEVQVVVPAIRKLPKIALTEKGYVKRVRGTCAGSKISTSILN